LCSKRGIVILSKVSELSAAYIGLDYSRTCKLSSLILTTYTSDSVKVGLTDTQLCGSPGDTLAGITL
jgi:hypothetical protein